MTNLSNHLNDYLFVYRDCIWVKGMKNTVIHDLSKREIHSIPAAYTPLLEEFSEKRLIDIKAGHSAEDWSNVVDFITYLLDSKLATFVQDISVFPPIDLAWSTPFTITNAILDYSPASTYALESTLRQLNQLGCRHLQIRTYAPFSLVFFNEALALLEPLFFSSFELISDHVENIDLEALKTTMQTRHVCNKITLAGAPKDEIITLDRNHITTAHIILTKQEIHAEKHCGIVSPQNLFAPGLKQFTEIHNHNSCLNRKIGIDQYGHIKNCPSMSSSFGHIGETPLKRIVDQPEFKAKWNITKNKISTCNQCEFRYMCLDCRAYLSDPKDPNSKPLKCGYDPATGIWTDWMENELAKAAVEAFKLDNLTSLGE